MNSCTDGGVTFIGYSTVECKVEIVRYPVQQVYREHDFICDLHMRSSVDQLDRIYWSKTLISRKVNCGSC